MTESEERKRAIWERMSPRRRKFVERIGYDNWDPFQEPKDPIDIRKDATKRTTQELVREYLTQAGPDSRGNAYNGGVMEMALGIVNREDRILGMFEFACWYKDLLEKEGLAGKK